MPGGPEQGEGANAILPPHPLPSPFMWGIGTAGHAPLLWFPSFCLGTGLSAKLPLGGRDDSFTTEFASSLGGAQAQLGLQMRSQAGAWEREGIKWGRGQGSLIPDPLPHSISSQRHGGNGVEGRVAIFTADDFGLSSALNDAVALAHRGGVLRCASLMPGAPAAGEALALARRLPSLCVGVHLTLCQGRPVLPPEAVPDLVDGAGAFPRHPAATGWRYFARPGLVPQIRREFAAQIETVWQAGVRPWFLNSHLNLHLHPRLFPLVAELARQYDIPAVRLVREDWRVSLKAGAGRPLAAVLTGLTFALLSRRARRLARAAGLLVNDHLFGLLHDGEMTEAYLLALLPRLQPGVTEIYSHPALYADPQLLAAAPRYRRAEELWALLSPRLQADLARRSIGVSDFRSLARQHLR